MTLLKKNCNGKNAKLMVMEIKISFSWSLESKQVKHFLCYSDIHLKTIQWFKDTSYAGRVKWSVKFELVVNFFFFLDP